MTRSRLSSAPGRTAAAALAVAALLLGAGCKDRDAAATQQKGALSSGANCAGADVHTKHLNLFACTTCHPQGATYGFDQPYTFAGGTTTAGGTIVLHTQTAPTSCTVACHYPKGGTAKSVAWNTPGPLACVECHETARLPAAHPPVAPNATRADCQGCHVITGHMDGAVQVVSHAPEWADPASPGFHAYSANQGLAQCQSCHGQGLTGGAGRACGTCHDTNLPAGVASWRQNCVMCHGGVESQTGAPPKATWGNSADAVRVGAHGAHVAGSALAPPFDCGVCHTKPTDALSTGHLDGGTAEVVFGGIAAAGAPAWNRTTATCAVYCHGATLDAGGTNTAPSWTGAAVACGDCHGTPPPAPHPTVADLTGCVTCHPQTMDATGALIPPSSGGLHLDGVLEVSGTHAAGWIDRTSPNFHAYSANRGLAACQGCHGAALDGVGGIVSIGCNQCHGATWKTTCTTCHGGTDNATGAPPRATWGSTSAVAIGAHSSHVGMNPVSAPFACTECHATPVDALSAGHVSGSAGVAFAGPVSGLAATGTWNFPSSGAPTCSNTYCHGNFTRGSLTNTPSWTGANQAACGSCHPARPAAYLHRRHQRETGPGIQPWWPLAGGSTFPTCDDCHSGIAQSTSDLGTPALTVVDGSGPALHVDGKADVVFERGGSYTIDPWLGGTCSSMACHPGDVKYWPR